MALLSVKNVDKYYGTRGNITKAISNLSFDIESGDYIGIMGASGSGKTTLLNCIATIDSVSSGKIYIDGTDITQLKGKQLAKFRREKLGFIFQDFNLLDTLTIYENIALALTILNWPASRIDERVHQITTQLEIHNILEKYPYQISGGQKQRVASARALVTDPTLILADEPTGALDSKSARMLLESFNTLNELYNSTIIMVTHDAFAASYCNKIIFIKDGEFFSELIKGNSTRKQFFDSIISVVTVLGGDNNVVS